MPTNTAEKMDTVKTEPVPSGEKPGIDRSQIIQRVMEVLLNPKSIWKTIKAERSSVKDMYRNYIVILAAIPAICGFLGMTLIGVSVPVVGTWKMDFIPAFFTYLVNYGVLLAEIFIAAVIIEKLTPKFGGNVTLENAFKLMAYSMTAGFVAGIFSLIPVLGILGALLSLYGLYLYYQGIPEMTEVAKERRVGFFLTSIVSIIVVMFVLNLIVAGITQTAPDPTAFNRGGERTEGFDVQKFQEGMEELGKVIPQPSR